MLNLILSFPDLREIPKQASRSAMTNDGVFLAKSMDSWFFLFPSLPVLILLRA